jgi:hypothetical protein
MHHVMIAIVRAAWILRLSDRVVPIEDRSAE